MGEYADLDRPTLCLYTFATGDKCFSKVWWKNFYDALKKEYPNHNIIEVLPVENVSSLDFKIPAFYSKSIREMASFITHASVFITGDCGIMHLAAATDTPTIGLFNVTNKDMYEPYNKACLYHLSFEITAIKRPFFLSISLQKETITTAMLYFSNLYKEKNHHFLLQ